MPEVGANPLQPRFLIIGEILRPHGIAGELRMKVLTNYPERLRQLKTVYLAENVDSENPQPYDIQSVRMHQEYALMRFKGINDRDAADHLRQLVVMVAIDDAIPLEEGELYLYQLIGLEVRLENGDLLGQITEVLETGANDVYIVKSDQYGEVLIPAIPQTIRSIDRQTRIMTVHLPEGLLP
ncbi:MAG: 16S rRNA processing protein RimM [Anaerolineae bacterium]|nr:16S rRNA processing protein RimM [Anaerolineae bacterium]MBN8617957.1 16S rRNA processing protein RimM [Anaerolineae bacterium]